MNWNWIESSDKGQQNLYHWNGSQSRMKFFVWTSWCFDSWPEKWNIFLTIVIDTGNYRRVERSESSSIFHASFNSSAVSHPTPLTRNNNRMFNFFRFPTCQSYFICLTFADPLGYLGLGARMRCIQNDF